MKDLVEDSIAKHRAFCLAQSDFNVARGKLQSKLKKYAKQKSQELIAKCTKFKVDTPDLFIVDLDGGSATSSWKPEGGFCSTWGIYNGNDPGAGFWDLTENHTWIKRNYINETGGFEAIEYNGEDGPISARELINFVKEMSEETGLKWTVRKEPISKELIERTFDKFTYLDGTVWEGPPKEDDEYGCRCD